MKRTKNGGRDRKKMKGFARISLFKLFLAFIVFMIASTSFFTILFQFPALQLPGDCGNCTLAAALATSKVFSLLPPPPVSSIRGNDSHRFKAIPSHKHSLEFQTDDSPYTVLHTVTSRFMVGQAPNATHKQLEIQRARYLLFETFCWPTMKYQTSTNYFWLVLVDPGLDPGLIRNMTNLLSNKTHFPAGNAFLVLTSNTEWSSDGVGVDNLTSYAVGLQPVAQEFKDGNVEILTGNTDLLLKSLRIMSGKTTNDFLQTPQKPLLVIETLLDTDDGLNNQAVEWIRKTAIQKTELHWDKQKQQQLSTNTSSNMQHSSPTLSPSLKATWWLLCGTDHLEWHNREIFQLTEQNYSNTGISSGIVGLRKSPMFCASAGFTRVGLTTPPTSLLSTTSNYSHMVFPRLGYSNHAQTFLFPECSTTALPNGNYSACWHREYPNDVFIIKSRTITSDSMDHLHVSRTKDYRDVDWLNASAYPLLMDDMEHLWEILGHNFSVSRKKAWETSAYIFEHRLSILHQNMDSRCSSGFPCSKSARRNILKMDKYWRKQKRGNKTSTARRRQRKNGSNTTSPLQKDRKHRPGENGSKGTAAIPDDNSQISFAEKIHKYAEMKRELMRGIDQTNATQMRLVQTQLKEFMMKDDPDAG